MRHIIAVLLENEAGALLRVVGLFAQRNYNIESLTVAPTEDPTLSRLTLTTIGDDSKIEQIMKHLYKVVEVVKVVDLSEADHIERELMLVKIRAEGDAREEVKRTADIFRGQIVDVTPNGYTVQLSGPSDKLDAFVRAVGKPQGTMRSNPSSRPATLSAKPWIATRRCTCTPNAQIFLAGSPSAAPTHSPGASRRQRASMPSSASTPAIARAIAVTCPSTPPRSRTIG